MATESDADADDVRDERRGEEDAPDDVAPDIAEDVEPDVPEVVPPLAERLADDQVRAGVITHPRELIGGVKADGRVGDIKLYNAHVAFVIEGARRASGYRYWGGMVVDADVVRLEGQPGEDLFGEVIPTWNLAIFQPESVEVVDDGAESGEAHVRLRGHSAPMAFAESFIRDVLNPPPVDLEMTYDYTLGASDRGLRLEVTLHNRELVVAHMDWPVLLSNHGDGLRQWVPREGYGFDFGIVDALTLTSGGGLAYSLVSGGEYELIFDYSNVGLLKAPNFDLEGAADLLVTYHLFVTDHGAAGIDRLLAEHRGLPAPERTFTGTVALPPGAAARDAQVVLWENLTPVTFTTVDEEGRFSLEAPAGDYFFIAYVPGFASSNTVLVEADDAPSEIRLAVPAHATLRVAVQDSDGGAVPARVTVVAETSDDADSPTAPEIVRHGSKGDWRWLDEPGQPGHLVSAVGLAADGTTVVHVPAGRYRVYATRGFNYSIAQEPVTLAAAQDAQLSLTIDKVVDTTGWISSDFHVHAIRSPDSDTGFDVRVRQAVTEELNLPILTEHVTLGGLQPTIDALELGDETVGPFGQEVTTFVYGHFNAFPLTFQADQPNFGAIFPYDKTPQELFDAIRNQNPGEDIIQVAHPRQGVPAGYFDYVRYDPMTGQPRRPDGWSTDWDAIEVFSARCLPDADNTATLMDWVTMTSLGEKKTLSSGSDTHYEYEPPGLPRNWIRADLGAIRRDPQALVTAVRARRMFVSCGPFVTFETEDGVGSLGDLVPVDAQGQIRFRVRVQAPTWMALDAVRLYRNGVMRLERRNLTHTSAQRFDAVLADTPDRDAWYTVEVVGHGSMWPVHPNGTPYAYTNPIEVDANRDARWTPPGLP